ncbi:MAG: ATP synthase F1 subunit delta [Acidobacteriota bacterium]
MAAIDLRYARALAAVINDQKLDAVAAQGNLNDFADTLEESFELREVLGDPSIPEAQKLKVLDGIAKKMHMSQPVRNFLAVITHHQRLEELRDIIAGYASLVDADTQVAEAEVVSARKLDAGIRALLEEQIGKLAGGQKVRATYSEDETLLGGAVVRLGSTVYDGSIKTQLERLKQRLVSAAA